MLVEYKKVSDKNWGLHIQGASRALRNKLTGFVVHNNQWLDAPFHAQCKQAGPFIQSDSYGYCRDDSADDKNSYLFIEFWSCMEKHQEFLALMLKDAEIELSTPTPVSGSAIVAA